MARSTKYGTSSRSVSTARKAASRNMVGIAIAVESRAAFSVMPFFRRHSHTHSPILAENASPSMRITPSLGSPRSEAK